MYCVGWDVKPYSLTPPPPPKAYRVLRKNRHNFNMQLLYEYCVTVTQYANNTQV